MGVFSSQLPMEASGVASLGEIPGMLRGYHKRNRGMYLSTPINPVSGGCELTSTSCAYPGEKPSDKERQVFAVLAFEKGWSRQGDQAPPRDLLDGRPCQLCTMANSFSSVHFSSWAHCASDKVWPLSSTCDISCYAALLLLHRGERLLLSPEHLVP